MIKAVDSCWFDSLFEKLPNKLLDTFSKVIKWFMINQMSGFDQKASNKQTLQRCFVMVVLFCSFGREQLINLYSLIMSFFSFVLDGRFVLNQGEEDSLIESHLHYMTGLKASTWSDWFVRVFSSPKGSWKQKCAATNRYIAYSVRVGCPSNVFVQLYKLARLFTPLELILLALFIFGQAKEKTSLINLLLRRQEKTRSKVKY